MKQNSEYHEMVPEILNDVEDATDGDDVPDFINSIFNWQAEYGILDKVFIKLNQLEDKTITPFNKKEVIKYDYDEENEIAVLDDLQEYNNNKSKLNGLPQTIKGHIAYHDPEKNQTYGKIHVKIDISYDFDEEIEKLEG